MCLSLLPHAQNSPQNLFINNWWKKKGEMSEKTGICKSLKMTSRESQTILTISFHPNFTFKRKFYLPSYSAIEWLGEGKKDSKPKNLTLGWAGRKSKSSKYLAKLIFWEHGCDYTYFIFKLVSIAKNLKSTGPAVVWPVMLSFIIDSVHACSMKSIGSLEKGSHLPENVLPNLLLLLHIKEEVPIMTGLVLEVVWWWKARGGWWEAFEIQ